MCRNRFWTTLIVCCMFATVAAEPVRASYIYDAAADFSPTSNPNGVWSYGWSATLGGAFQLYTQSGPDNADSPRPICLTPGMQARAGSSRCQRCIATAPAGWFRSMVAQSHFNQANSVIIPDLSTSTALFGSRHPIQDRIHWRLRTVPSTSVLRPTCMCCTMVFLSLMGW